MDPAEALAAAFVAAHEPVEALRRAVLPVLAAQNGNGAAFRLRGEPLADGGVRLSVTNVARGETWPIEMSAADRRALARELNRR